MRIRQSPIAPGGIPDILFNVPSKVGFLIKGKYVDDDDINTAKSDLAINNQPLCLDDDIHEILLCYVHIHNLEIPQDSGAWLGTLCYSFRLPEIRWIPNIT